MVEDLLANGAGGKLAAGGDTLPTTDLSYAPRDDEGSEPATIARLFEVYSRRHSDFTNWLPTSGFLYRAIRPLGGRVYIGAASYVARAIALSALLVSVPLLVALLTETWDPWLAARWAVIAMVWGAFTLWFQWTMERADGELLSLHGALAKVESVRDLIEWDLRWFRYSVVGALAFVVLSLVVLVYVGIQTWVGWVPVAPGTLALGACLFWIFGETSGALALLVAEYPLLAQQRYQLYRPDPAATLAIQRSLRGHNRFALLASLYMTATILATASLLSAARPLALPVTVGLLALAYATVTTVVVAPRLLMSAIVRRAKDAELPTLQAEITQLWVRVDRLDEAEYERYQRLRARHDELVKAPSDLLNVAGVLGKVSGSLLLPTAVAVLATLANRMLR